MKRLAFIILAASVAACSQADLDRFTSIVDTAETVLGRVHQGFEKAETAAKRYCPDLQLLGASARALKCAAGASGTDLTRLTRIASYRKAFCDNPSAESAAQLVAYIAEGLRVARAATAAGCQE